MNLHKITDSSTSNETTYSVGVDIGGTNTVFGIVDCNGVIIATSRFSTAGFSTAEEFTAGLSERILSLLKDNGIADSRVAGIGIGAPCANFITGVIEGATNLPWPSPIPLRDLVEDITGMHVATSNDANATAIGEMIYGVAQGMRNFIVITLGTGVGSGIVCDGRLLTGHRGFAGELGHCSIRRESDRLCECGRYGCLQTYCAASGVCRTARQILSAHPETPSRLRDIPEEQFTAEAICLEAQKGDNLAIETFRFTGEILGEACADFATFCDPEAIILFGGVAKAGNLLINPMKMAMEQNLLHIYRDRIQILQSRFSEAQAAILGAAAMIHS